MAMTEVLPQIPIGNQLRPSSLDERKVSSCSPRLTHDYLSNQDFRLLEKTYTSVSPILSTKTCRTISYQPCCDGNRILIGQLMSTPASIKVSLNGSHSSGPSGKINRPKTAAAVLAATKTDCDRVYQVESEPTRRHNLENHIPAKRGKPPPWQKNLDPPLVPFVVGPGYLLQRSKSKFAMTIKDEFFDPVLDEVQKKKQETERDSLVQQLQQQISDLSLYLEEERLNHKQTKQRAEENLRDRTEELQQQHTEHVRDLEEDHRQAMDKLKQGIEGEHAAYRTNAEAQISKMKKEIEFLQGAFESYKSSLHQDMDEKWNKREEELGFQMQEERQAAVHEARTRLIQERNSEKIAMQKEHQKAIDSLRKEHKKELDALVRRFSNVAADLERLKKTTAELNETKRELEIVTASYNDTCQQLANITRTLADTQVKLLSYEEQFEEKVQQVDAKYQHKINDLMTRNIELKRLYVKKCGQLYDEKVSMEMNRIVRVQSAKEVMHSLLKSKQRSNVSFKPGDPEHEGKESQPKSRPGSAPSTRIEREKAHVTAGQTDHLTEQFDSEIPQAPDNVFMEVSEEVEEMRRQIMEEVKIPSKEEMLKSLEEL